MSIDKIDNTHAPKIQGRVLLRKKSVCGRIIDHGMVGGTLESMERGTQGRVQNSRAQDMYLRKIYVAITVSEDISESTDTYVI